MLNAFVLGLITLVFGLVSCESERPASWSYIHQSIIAPNCTTVACHSRVSGQSGVRLESATTAYSILTGKACKEDTNSINETTVRNFVFPGDPERSELVHLLRGQNVKRSMPPDRLLPLVDVELIEEWILEGASCN